MREKNWLPTFLTPQAEAPALWLLLRQTKVYSNKVKETFRRAIYYLEKQVPGAGDLPPKNQTQTALYVKSKSNTAEY